MSIQKTITPIDNSVYLERPLSTQNEIDKVIENSKKSFQSWRNTSIEDRITIINKFIDNSVFVWAVFAKRRGSSLKKNANNEPERRGWFCTLIGRRDKKISSLCAFI